MSKQRARTGFLAIGAAALAAGSRATSATGRCFRQIMRLYVPGDVLGILGGRTWQPPTVLPCQTNGRTSEGVARAS